MRLTQTLTLLGLAALGSTAAIDPALTERSGDLEARHCLCQSDAEKLIAAYTRMINKWDDADAKYLAEDFKDTSDSINQLAGLPLGSVIFPSKQAFIDHQHVAPDNLPLVVTRIGPFNCDTASFIWSATFGAPGNQKPVRGITILGATKQAGFFQIKSIDVEFNNIAFLLNIGGSYKMPGQP